MIFSCLKPILLIDGSEASTHLESTEASIGELAQAWIFTTASGVKLSDREGVRYPQHASDYSKTLLRSWSFHSGPIPFIYSTSCSTINILVMIHSTKQSDPRMY